MAIRYIIMTNILYAEYASAWFSVKEGKCFQRGENNKQTKTKWRDFAEQEPYPARRVIIGNCLLCSRELGHQAPYIYVTRAQTG